MHLPFVSQYFWKNLGGCGHRDVPPKSQKIELLGGIVLGHQGPRRRDIPDHVPDKNFAQGALLCCFRHGMAGTSRDLGRTSWDLGAHLGHLKKHYSPFAIACLPTETLFSELNRRKFWGTDTDL